MPRRYSTSFELQCSLHQELFSRGQAALIGTSKAFITFLPSKQAVLFQIKVPTYIEVSKHFQIFLKLGTGSPLLTRVLGPEKNRVNGKLCNSSILVLKTGYGTFSFQKSTF